MPLKSLTRTATVVAATAAAGASGAVIADAASRGSTSTTPSAAQQPYGGARPGFGETALTGDVQQKVEAAALAKVPGATVIRSETEQGGAYEVHVRKADGTEVEVRVAADFTVTGVQTRPAGGPGGRGGFGGRGHGHGPGGPRGDLTAVAKALGVTDAKLLGAVQAARPDRGPGDLVAALAKELGQSTADVQSVLEASRPSGDRGRHGPGGDSTLAAALAAKFSISQAKAQAALDAVHQAKDADRSAERTAFYAAVAKALGQDAAAVQKAFEANLPAPPTP